MGANIGYYSLLASAYNPALDVRAFEPSPVPFRYLSDNCVLNARPTITPVPIALSDQSGTIDFYPARNPRYPEWDQIGGTGSSNAEQAAMHGEADHVRAQAQTLDAYRTADPRDVPVGLIKIDVEGGELSVIKGAANVVEQDRPVVIFESLAHDENRAELFAFFHDRSYNVRLATPTGLVDASDAASGDDRWRNYVALPSRDVA